MQQQDQDHAASCGTNSSEVVASEADQKKISASACHWNEKRTTDMHGLVIRATAQKKVIYAVQDTIASCHNEKTAKKAGIPYVMYIFCPQFPLKKLDQGCECEVPWIYEVARQDLRYMTFESWLELDLSLIHISEPTRPY